MGSLKHITNTQMSVKPGKQHTSQHQAKYTLRTPSEHSYGYLCMESHAQYTNTHQNAVATAYNLSNLPLLVVTDRRGKVRQSLTEASYGQERLRSLIEERLAEEPQ